jgi:hypothetical protein
MSLLNRRIYVWLFVSLLISAPSKATAQLLDHILANADELMTKKSKKVRECICTYFVAE